MGVMLAPRLEIVIQSRYRGPENVVRVRGGERTSTVRRHSQRAIAIVGVAILGLTAACSSASKADPSTPSTDAPAPTTPTPSTATPRTTPAAPTVGVTWPRATPASVGLDATKLTQIATTAEAGNSNCLFVVRGAQVVFESYYRGKHAGDVQDIFSATKSIASILVGIAQDGRDLKVTDSASKWIPQWKGTAAQAVTVRDLLSSDSGREWSPAIDYGQLLAASDRTAFAIGLAQTSAPGTVWAYNNSADQTLERVLEKATGEDVVTFAKERLFDPLGMTETTLTRDKSGHAQLFEGATSSCRDMARFGQLLLNDGTWGTKQIVSASWIHDATAVSSSKLNAAYGYLFWLNHSGVIGDPLVATNLADAANPKRYRGRLVPDAPNSMFWALGLGNQIVQVDPGSGTVVVRLGTAQARPKPPTFGPAEASKVVTTALLPGRSKG
jgi:CubicO group peptidase (beta-lactamase class C family)